jgi:hypothetical protein
MKEITVAYNCTYTVAVLIYVIGHDFACVVWNVGTFDGIEGVLVRQESARSIAAPRPKIGIAPCAGRLVD